MGDVVVDDLGGEEAEGTAIGCFFASEANFSPAIVSFADGDLEGLDGGILVDDARLALAIYSDGAICEHSFIAAVGVIEAIIDDFLGFDGELGGEAEVTDIGFGGVDVGDMDTPSGIDGNGGELSDILGAFEDARGKGNAVGFLGGDLEVAVEIIVVGDDQTTVGEGSDRGEEADTGGQGGIGIFVDGFEADIIPADFFGAARIGALVGLCGGNAASGLTAVIDADLVSVTSTATIGNSQAIGINDEPIGIGFGSGDFGAGDTKGAFASLAFDDKVSDGGDAIAIEGDGGKATDAFARFIDCVERPLTTALGGVFERAIGGIVVGDMDGSVCADSKRGIFSDVIAGIADALAGAIRCACDGACGGNSIDKFPCDGAIGLLGSKDKVAVGFVVTADNGAVIEEGDGGEEAIFAEFEGGEFRTAAIGACDLTACGFDGEVGGVRSGEACFASQIRAGCGIIDTLIFVSLTATAFSTISATARKLATALTLDTAWLDIVITRDGFDAGIFGA